MEVYIKWYTFFQTVEEKTLEEVICLYKYILYSTKTTLKIIIIYRKTVMMVEIEEYCWFVCLNIELKCGN